MSSTCELMWDRINEEPLSEKEIWYKNNCPIKLNSCWQPTTGRTGCGIVLKIEESKFGYTVYHFVTDFGNICLFTREELIDNYDFVKVDPDPRARLERQVQLLVEAELLYLM